MRLTKEQIEQSQLGVLYMVPSVISDNLCHILAALAAYERVVNLMSSWESDRGRGSAAWDDTMGPIVEEMRRALDGDE